MLYTAILYHILPYYAKHPQVMVRGCAGILLLSLTCFGQPTTGQEVITNMAILLYCYHKLHDILISSWSSSLPGLLDIMFFLIAWNPIMLMFLQGPWLRSFLEAKRSSEVEDLPEDFWGIRGKRTPELQEWVLSLF